MVGLSQRLGGFGAQEVVTALQEAAASFAKGPLAAVESERS
jgi:hypothetical protein